MTLHFGHELAIVAIVCVLGIFLFPAAAGSYSAVHGPVTALEAMRNSIRLRGAIAAAALRFLGMASQFFNCALRQTTEWLLPATASPTHSPLLRC